MKAFVTILVTVCLLVLMSLVLSGCGSDALVAEDTVAELMSEITEPMTGASLKLAVSSYDLEVTDQLVVDAEIRWVDGVQVELIEPVWAESGWTLRERVESAYKFDGTAYILSVEFTLDPYLDGSYVIPSFGIRASNQEYGKRIARLNEIPIRVVSVLEEDDDSVLAGPAGFTSLPAEVKDNGRTKLALIFFGAGLCMLGVTAMLYYFRSHELRDEHLAPRTIIGVIANADQISEADAGSFYRAVQELLSASEGGANVYEGDPGEFVTGVDREALELISEDIEGIRFSGSGFDPDGIRAAAQRVRTMLEVGS